MNDVMISDALCEDCADTARETVLLRRVVSELLQTIERLQENQ